MPLRLGHRGAPIRVRENTLESFRQALEAGLDGVDALVTDIPEVLV